MLHIFLLLIIFRLIWHDTITQASPQGALTIYTNAQEVLAIPIVLQVKTNIQGRGNNIKLVPV